MGSKDAHEPFHVISLPGRGKFALAWGGRRKWGMEGALGWEEDGQKAHWPAGGPSRERVGLASGQILIPFPSSPALYRAAWFFTIDLAGRDLSSSTKVAGALLGVRGHKSPYSELCSLHLLTGARYSAGHLACLFQCRLGLGCFYEDARLFSSI